MPRFRSAVDIQALMRDTRGMSEQPPFDIPPEEWAVSPASVRAMVQILLSQLSLFSEEVRKLRAKVNQTSKNPSKPPSSDPPSAPPRPTSPPRGRKPGGQPGHPGHARPLLDESDVREIVSCHPAACARSAVAQGLF